MVVDCSLCCASLQPQCPVEPSGFATLRQGTWLLLRQPQRTASASFPSVRSRRFLEASRNDVWPRWHRWRKHILVGRPALGCGAPPWTICSLSNSHLTAFLKAGELLADARACFHASFKSLMMAVFCYDRCLKSWLPEVLAA